MTYEIIYRELRNPESFFAIEIDDVTLYSKFRLHNGNTHLRDSICTLTFRLFPTETINVNSSYTEYEDCYLIHILNDTLTKYKAIYCLNFDHSISVMFKMNL